ncbi:MAG: hypothetical protein Q9160_004931 [Pyrenula sp. 1 TL-2023]
MYKSRFTAWGVMKKPQCSSKKGGQPNQTTSVRREGRAGQLGGKKEKLTAVMTAKVESDNAMTTREVVFSTPMFTTPEDPQTLKNPASVLQLICNYLSGSLESGNFFLDTSVSKMCLASSKPGGNQLSTLKGLFSTHYRACALLDQGLFSEAGSCLDNAFASLKGIILTEHPGTAIALYAIVLHLRLRRRAEISALLLRHYAGLISIYHGERHPLVQLTRVFLPLDESESFHCYEVCVRAGDKVCQSYLTTKPHVFADKDCLRRAMKAAEEIECELQTTFSSRDVKQEPGIKPTVKRALSCEASALYRLMNDALSIIPPVC